MQSLHVCYVCYCYFHNVDVKITCELMLAVKESNCEKVEQYYERTGELPCNLINFATKMDMWNLLAKLGCRCECSKFNNAVLNEMYPSKNMHLLRCELDDVVQKGDLTKVRQCLRQNKKLSLTNSVWNNFVIQDFFVKELYPVWSNMLQDALPTVIPAVVIAIITEYLKSWDDFKIKIQK